MKHTILKSLAVAGMAALLGTSAFAANMIIITGNGDYRVGSGGEFNVRAYNAGGAAVIGDVFARGYFEDAGVTIGTADGTAMGGTRTIAQGGTLATALGLGFETFCIEYNEHISLGGIYDVSISLGSIYGGVAGGIGGPPTTDLISVGTAYLYSKFADGSLAGYTYANGADRVASAVLLQEAIWYLEDEVTLTEAQKTANLFLKGSAGAITLFGDGTGVGVGGAKANNTYYNVAALNLGGVDPNQKQDQLILHDNGFSTPDGGITIMLLGFAVSGLALIRRKVA